MNLIGTHFGTYEIDRGSDGSVQLNAFRHDPQPSALGKGLIDLAAHPLRVTRPAIRRGWLDRNAANQHGAHQGPSRGADCYVEVSWETAISLLADELKRVKASWGNAAIFGGSYGWASAGRFHHAQSQLKRFLNLIGGHTSAVNTYSFGAGAVILPHVFGRPYSDTYAIAPSWDQICEHTEVLISFGGMRRSNAEVESGGCGEHIADQWLRKLDAKSRRFVVFSPHRPDLPEGIRGEHHFIRPNTDLAVMLALATEVLLAGRHDAEFIRRYTHGFETFADYLRGKGDGEVKDAQWAERISGVPAAVIRSLATDLGSRRSLLNLSWSLQRADHGEQAYWAGAALAALTGQIGLPGGGVCFGLMAVNSIGRPVRRLKGQAVEQGPNPVRDFIPVARIADMLLHPGESIDYDGAKLRLPDIKLVYWAGGNPFHHHQDINRLRRAFQRPETIVVHESVWTATALHADIVLPATLSIERNDLAVSPRDKWLVASKRALAPHGEARNDHDIFADLADRFGVRSQFTEDRSEMEWVEKLYQRYAAAQPGLPSFDEFWATGYAEAVGADMPFNPFADFRADPEAFRLTTPSGKIELSSEVVAGFGYADCPGHPKWIEPREWLGSTLAARLPLHLLSPQPATRLHSQLELVGASQSSKVGGRERILIHVSDAQRRGIQQDDLVRVFNDRGACLAAAVLTDQLMPGVVSLATGAWYHPIDPRDPQSLDLGGNPNMLTHDRGTSSLAQGPAANSSLVEIERYGGTAPLPMHAARPDLVEATDRSPAI